MWLSWQNACLACTRTQVQCQYHQRQVRWCRPVTPGSKRWKQDKEFKVIPSYPEFEASLSYVRQRILTLSSPPPPKTTLWITEMEHLSVSLKANTIPLATLVSPTLSTNCLSLEQNMVAQLCGDFLITKKIPQDWGDRSTHKEDFTPEPHR